MQEGGAAEEATICSDIGQSTSKEGDPAMRPVTLLMLAALAGLAAACGTSSIGSGEDDAAISFDAPVPIETCTDGVTNQDETDTDCGGVCPPCSTGAQCTDNEDCESQFCDGLVCALCSPNSFGCLGNTPRQCAADGWSWVSDVDCGLAAKCVPATGECGPIPMVGNPPGPDDVNITGAYFKFAHFTQADGLADYCFISDVDSYGDLIYVHAVSPPCPDSYAGVQGHVDVYRVTLLDSDEDGVLEPNQHPDNPDNTGLIEERVLTHVTTIAAPIGPVHHSEIYATADKLYFPGMDELFVEYDLVSGDTFDIVDGSVITPAGGRGISFSGYDEDNALWYFATEVPRRVYSYDPAIGAWVPEFDYPDMSGDHMDGMEFVKDPNSGEGYVYLTDMTSDYIGQYKKDAAGNWEQVNLFHYADPDVEVVEGMGFGVLNHFWVGGWSSGVLYELGGGDLGTYVE